MAYNPTGWEAVGYGLAGGFKRDAEERKKLQQVEMEYRKAQTAQMQAGTTKTEQETKLLQEQYNQLHRQTTMLQNQMAAKDLEYATDALVTNGNYEEFNKVLSTNPVIQQKMFNNYGVKSIRPIDWNNKQDIAQLKKAGLDDKSIELAMKDPEVREKISKAYYMTDAGHLTSVDDFVNQTGYLNRVTSDKFDAYLKFRNDIASIGKKYTTEEVEAKSAEKWLTEHPDKTWNDWLAEQKKAMPEDKRVTTNADLKNEYADLEVLKSKGELKGDQEVRYKVLKKLFETDNDEKRDILAKGIEITKKYQDKLFETDIDENDIINAKLFAQQAGIRPDTKDNREFKDQFNILKQGKRLVDEVSVLDDEEIARGMVDTGIQKLKTLMADGTIPDEKMLKSINMQTKLGKFLAAYIKSISGTAVAEQEYKRLSELFGGDVWTNTDTLKEAVKTFVGELDKEFKDKAKTSLLDNPSTTLDLVNKYKKLYGGDSTSEKQYVIDPNTNKPTQHYVGEVIEHQGKKYKIVNANGDMEEIK